MGERSVPNTAVSGYSSAKSIAQIPVPVPRSRALSISFAIGARCSLSSRARRYVWWLLGSGLAYASQSRARDSYLISRLSFCLSSFGALVGQSITTRKPTQIASDLTSTPHLGRHDSDGHFQADTGLSRARGSRYPQHYFEYSAAASDPRSLC